MELLDDTNISPIFNIANIFEYYEMDEEMENNTDFPKKKKDIIKRIINSRIRKSTRGKDYIEYLFEWEDQPIEDSSWIKQDGLDLYDPG